MIKARNLSFSYYGDKLNLDNLSFTLADGKVMGILGPNGAGKSTLIQLMAGLLSPGSGFLEVGSFKNPGHEKILRQKTVFIPQNIDHWLLGATVKEDLAIGLNLKDSRVREKLEKLSYDFDLGNLYETPVNELSTGQKKRLGLAAALAKEPLAIFLDEPLAALDWPGTQVMLETLTTLKRNGHSMAIITHDPQIIAPLVDHWLILRAGRLAAQGGWLEVSPHFASFGVRPVGQQ